jgi:mRNA interferase MazF
MNVRRGEVILVDFIHADRMTSSLRPALVVQSDHNNQRLHNTIVAQITSRLRHLHEPTRLLVDPATPEGASSGLHMPSVVTCENLLTIREDLIHHTLGRLSDPLMQRVNDSLKAAMGLP